MPKIRVLVVDDSTLVRRLLSDAISETDDFEVAGTAPNGKIALSKIGQLHPDIVSLDLEMPEMDGMETIRAIREQYPDLPIVLFSSGITAGADEARDALCLGANDFLAKPSKGNHEGDAKAYVQSVLLPKLRKIYRESSPHAASSTAQLTFGLKSQKSASNGSSAKPRSPHRVDVIAIGVSTGGPQALSCLLAELPSNLAVPVVIVQHMPPIFTKHLADRLSKLSPLRVREAFSGAPLLPGEAWIAPGDFHLTVSKNANQVLLETHQGPPENSCRPAVDVLFRSVSQVYGPSALACILTGMGQDGLQGSKWIHDAGGAVIAQDEATSVVWGMPRAVAQAGLADLILPLDKIGEEIIFRVQHQRPRTPLQATIG